MLPKEQALEIPRKMCVPDNHENRGFSEFQNMIFESVRNRVLSNVGISNSWCTGDVPSTLIFDTSQRAFEMAVCSRDAPSAAEQSLFSTELEAPVGPGPYLVLARASAQL
jgi:hypothetical protein